MFRVMIIQSPSENVIHPGLLALGPQYILQLHTLSHTYSQVGKALCILEMILDHVLSR